MMTLAISFALIVLAAILFREGGVGKEHDLAFTKAIQEWYPDYRPRKRILPKFLLRGLSAVCVAMLAVPWTAAGLVPGAIIAAALAIGFTTAPGNAVGPALHGVKPDINRAERWQVGKLIHSTWLLLAVLGAIRAIGVLALAIHNIGYLPMAVLIVAGSTAASVIAVWLAVRVNGGILGSHQGGTAAWAAETIRSEFMWGWQEYAYAALLALVVFAAARIA